MKYANITPITIIFNKPEADKLSVTIQGDNLSSQAQFNYTLLAGNESLLCGSVTIEGEEYLTWDGNNDFPFEYVAGQIGVEIIDIVEEPLEEVSIEL